MKHQKQLSNLNLEFSFCSDATKHQDDKENAKPLLPTRQPAHFSSVNIFTTAKSADEEETKKSPQKQEESLFKLNIPPISPRKPFELDSATEVLRFPHSQELTRHTSSQNRYQQVDEAASLCESREEAAAVQVGDFTYKEKEAMETMIQQLEKELFKEQQQYDSRPQV